VLFPICSLTFVTLLIYRFISCRSNFFVTISKTLTWWRKPLDAKIALTFLFFNISQRAHSKVYEDDFKSLRVLVVHPNKTQICSGYSSVFAFQSVFISYNSVRSMLNLYMTKFKLALICYSIITEVGRKC
jgi:hypothetical protein